MDRVYFERQSPTVPNILKLEIIIPLQLFLGYVWGIVSVGAYMLRRRLEQTFEGGLGFLGLLPGKVHGAVYLPELLQQRPEDTQ